MTLPHLEFRETTRPGRMTAAMRVSEGVVAGKDGPKRLRVGVVQGGIVLEERVIAASAHVSVGTSEENTLLIAAADAPASFRLFEHIDSAYYLNFRGGMRGRVLLPNGLFELQDLEAQARAAGGAYRIALTEAARGRVLLGEVTFLFHFVAPPPVLPKAVLPSAVLRGPRSVDWTSTLCAAVSFLVHFLLLGAVYSDWADPVLDDDSSVAGLVDSLQHLPPPPPIEDKIAPDEVRPPEQAANAPSEEKPSPRAPAEGPSRAPARGEAREAALSEQLARLDTAILGVFASEKPATSGILRKSELAFGALDAAARSSAGVGSGSELELKSAGATLQRGASDNLRDLGSKQLGPEGSGRSASVSGPRVDARVAPPTSVVGVVSDAARVVAGMRAGFRACYQRGLAENPDASGGIRLTIRIGPAGEVLAVTASPSGNLPESVVRCVQSRAQVAQFAAPEGGSAAVVVPVTFVKQ